MTEYGDLWAFHPLQAAGALLIGYWISDVCQTWKSAVGMVLVGLVWAMSMNLTRGLLA